MAPNPKYVLVAGNDEDKDMVAKLQAAMDEMEKKAKKAMDEKEELEGRLKAMEKEVPATPGPVVKAIITAMDDEHKEEAKKAAMDEIEKTAMDEDKKTEAKKAIENIFETGNGVNTNSAKTADHLEEEKTAVMKALTARAAEPIINQILSAKQRAGATPDDLTKEKSRLSAMSLPEIDKEYATNEIFIKQSLTQATEQFPTESSLTASMEKEFTFNGAGPLTGKAIDIDEALEGAIAQ